MAGLPALEVLQQADIERRIREEGQPFFMAMALTNTSFGGSVLLKNLSGGGLVYPGRVFIPKTVNGKATRELGLFIDIGGSSPTGYFQNRIWTSGSIAVSVDLPPITEGSASSATVERFAADDGDALFSVRASINGYSIAKGYDTASNFIFLVEGDSNKDLSAFAGGSDRTMFQGKVRDYFNSLGFTCRVVNKAKGSADSANLVAQVSAGVLDITEKVNVRFCMMGTNNIVKAFIANGNNLTQPQIDAAIAIYISDMSIRINDHILKYGTEETLIVAGPPPIYNTVQEGAMVQLRNALRNLVVGIGGAAWYGGNTPIAKPVNKIWFTSIGQTDSNAGLFEANNYDNYLEKSGNALHLDATRQSLEGDYYVNMLTVNEIQ